MLRQRLHSIDHATPETCPQCTYRFVPGLKPHEREETAAKLEAYLTQIEQAQTRLQGINTFMEEAETYIGHYQRWRGFVNQYPRLHLLWDHIQEHGYFFAAAGCADAAGFVHSTFTGLLVMAGSFLAIEWRVSKGA